MPCNLQEEFCCPTWGLSSHRGPFYWCQMSSAPATCMESSVAPCGIWLATGALTIDARWVFRTPIATCNRSPVALPQDFLVTGEFFVLHLRVDFSPPPLVHILNSGCFRSFVGCRRCGRQRPTWSLRTTGRQPSRTVSARGTTSA